ncbi:hypothetical protein HYT84_04555 [Candidatus Micrarchaeota archaeon]|nr:hypothetical protein [Candidatus Micrarchaeota archaeon]
MDEQEIRKVLMRKLAKHGYWGGRHTSFDNLHKGFPKHLSKDVKGVANDLIKENLLIPKPTSYGLHVSLNPRMKEIIEQVIGL